MFIQTQDTPNPNTLKFLPGCEVCAQETAEFLTVEEAEQSPLAAKLFTITGISSVFFGEDFIAITKKQEEEWEYLKPVLLGIIMEHFTSGAPLFFSATQKKATQFEEESFDPKDSETVQAIKTLLAQRVQPAVAQDGGEIRFKGYKNGIVYLSMRGACAGCPSATLTLKQGVENLLRHFLPQISHIEAVSE